MMSYAFRHAMCNEAFEGRSFAGTCQSIRRAGYTGIEIAPFTLAENPLDISASQRKECRDAMASKGLTFVGLHWLMVSPKGLHVTGPDASLRQRSWDHVRNLIDLCADLGPNGVMIFGSPKQRCTTGGLSRKAATDHFAEGFASIAPHAEQRGVKVLVEALPADQCDVVQTLEEAVGIVKSVGSPAIQTMFDVHNAVDETEPHVTLVERFFDYIRHVHVNEMDGRHCGTGNYDFRPLFEVLRRRQYDGWISLEAFDFTPGADHIADESLRHLENQIQQID